MLQCHHYHHTLSTHIYPLSPHYHHHHHYHHHNPSVSLSSFLNKKPTTTSFLSFLPNPYTSHHHHLHHHTCLAQLPDPTTTSTPITPLQEGPIEIPPSASPIFATTDEPSAIQIATSVLLTGAISVFLFRSLRRRAQRAKELKFRSSGAKKTLKEEALDSLKAIQPGAIEPEKPPSPVQALLGGISAGVIAIILYKFTTTIESALNRQTMSDNFSVRQITITIRTIVNGLCYLATFVFGINSVGLFLYSAQLAINSFMEGFTSEEINSNGNEQSGSPDSTSETSTVGAELNSGQGDQNPDNLQ